MSNTPPGTATEFCSTLFSQYSVPPIRLFRRALDSDIEEAEYLLTSKETAVFGPKSIGFKIKRCFYSVVAINTEDQIVAIICLDDHPNIPALPGSEWEHWIVHLYNLDKVTPQNTLWIHLMTAESRYIHSFSKPLLEHIYLYFPFVTHLIAVVPGNVPIFCFLEENFTCVVPNGYTEPKKVQSLYITWRFHYTKKYKIRLAVEEDNDDIVPLIHTHSERLMQMYGEFYISELLTKHPGMDRKLIVAEIKERAVAVLILNGVVNYNCLYKSFLMEPYSKMYKIDLRTIADMHESGSSEFTDSADENIVQEKVFRKSIEPTFDDHPVQSLNDLLNFDLLNHASDVNNKYDIHVTPKMFSLQSPSVTYALDRYVKRVSIMTDDNSYAYQDQNYDNYEYQLASAMRPESYEAEVELPPPEANPIAFTLEVMAAGEEHEVAVLNDLLEASFQSFEDKEYCILSILHKMPHFPLMEYFVRVSPKKTSIFPQELYILHKNAIKANLEVHRMHKTEFTVVRKIISHIENNTILLDSITKSVFSSNSEYNTFVMKNYSIIVGILVVRYYPKNITDHNFDVDQISRQELDIEYFLMHYQIHKIIDFNVHKYDRFGFIEHCILSPIFQKHTPFFLREVHRLTDMSIILFKLEISELSQHTRRKPLPAILKDMLPVLNRILPEYNQIKLEGVKVPNWYLEPKDDMFSLYISTPRICSLPRMDVNSRLVVVGDSSTALSFLQALNFEYRGRKVVNFNNLHLIFDKITSDTTIFSTLSAGMFVSRGKFSANYMFSVGLHVNVNLIHGTMTDIDRKHKYVTVNSEVIVPYDYLFLMCGLQYTHPYGEGVRSDKSIQMCPTNVFTINKYKSADIAVNVLLTQAQNSIKKCNIIIYGSTLNAYCCIATILALNIPMYSITFVEPFQDENQRPSVDVFNNPPLHEAMHVILEMNNIEIYEGYYFSAWQLYRDNFITAVKFQSRRGFITLPCDFFFCYANKEVAHTTFTAINSAGIVYDGRVVIQPDCRTNDPYIFAAGPMTKYSRRFYADKFVHAYYDSHEIGEKLARQVRALLLPGGLNENEGDPIFDILNSKHTNKLVPQYEEPLVESCILPGKIHYFSIRTPGKEIPFETYMSSIKRGQIFETGDLKNLKPNCDPKYFRIEYNLNNFISKITCFTKQTINTVNLARLWGKHEKFLNNLQKKFNMGLISDFYEFFNSAYFCAIYSDTFLDVQQECTNILKLLTTQPGQSLIEDLISRFIKLDTEAMTLVEESKVKEKFLNSQYHTAIVSKVMEYLGKNYQDLPMYAHPLVTKLILDDYQNSPLFYPPEEN